MRKIILTLFAFFIGLSCFAQKPSIHLIMAAATDDAEAGSSCMTDVVKVSDAFAKYAKALKVKFDEHIVSGDNYSKQHLLSVFDSIKVRSNDVLVFVYSGHGFRFKDDTDVFPIMKLTYDDLVDENDYLSVSALYDILKSKKARLTICLSDCCNSKIDLARTEFETPQTVSRDLKILNQPSLKKLFVEASGSLKLSSAQPGQEAFGDGNGGFFLTSIIDNINEQADKKFKGTPSWNSIVSKSQEEVKSKAAGKTVKGQAIDPQVVVRNVSIEGEQPTVQETSENQGSDEGMSDGAFLAIVGAILIAIILGIVLIVKKNKDKAKK